jgi:hypothetical protein
MAILSSSYVNEYQIYSTILTGMSSKKSKKLIDEVVGEEEYMPTNQVDRLIHVSIDCLMFR